MTIMAIVILIVSHNYHTAYCTAKSSKLFYFTGKLIYVLQTLESTSVLYLPTEHLP